jgi:hypothetical protein
VVIGSRPIREHPEFGALKKRCNGRQLDVAAAGRGLGARRRSGFRAFTREAALKLNLYTTFSHCIESLIQAAGWG